MSRFQSELLFAGAGIDGKQCVDVRKNVGGSRILGIQLEGIDELSSAMGPTRSVDQSVSAHAVVSRVAVGL